MKSVKISRVNPTEPGLQDIEKFQLLQAGLRKGSLSLGHDRSLHWKQKVALRMNECIWCWEAPRKDRLDLPWYNKMKNQVVCQWNVWKFLLLTFSPLVNKVSLWLPWHETQLPTIMLFVLNSCTYISQLKNLLQTKKKHVH